MLKKLKLGQVAGQTPIRDFENDMKKAVGFVINWSHFGKAKRIDLLQKEHINKIKNATVFSQYLDTCAA